MAWMEVDNEGAIRLAIINHPKKPGIVLPLIARDRETAETQRDYAENLAQQTGHRIRLVRLYAGETIDEIMPPRTGKA